MIGIHCSPPALTLLNSPYHCLSPLLSLLTYLGCMTQTFIPEGPDSLVLTLFQANIATWVHSWLNWSREYKRHPNGSCVEIQPCLLLLFCVSYPNKDGYLCSCLLVMDTRSPKCSSSSPNLESNGGFAVPLARVCSFWGWEPHPLWAQSCGDEKQNVFQWIIGSDGKWAITSSTPRFLCPGILSFGDPVLYRGL